MAAEIFNKEENIVPDPEKNIIPENEPQSVSLMRGVVTRTTPSGEKYEQAGFNVYINMPEKERNGGLLGMGFRKEVNSSFSLRRNNVDNVNGEITDVVTVSSFNDRLLVESISDEFFKGRELRLWGIRWGLAALGYKICFYSDVSDVSALSELNSRPVVPVSFTFPDIRAFTEEAVIAAAKAKGDVMLDAFKYQDPKDKGSVYEGFYNSLDVARLGLALEESMVLINDNSRSHIEKINGLGSVLRPFQEFYVTNDRNYEDFFYNKGSSKTLNPFNGESPTLDFTVLFDLASIALYNLSNAVRKGKVNISNSN